MYFTFSPIVTSETFGNSPFDVIASMLVTLYPSTSERILSSDGTERIVGRGPDTLTVDGELISSIEKGYMLLLGVMKGDTEKEAELLARKTASLRVFEDENGKTNKSLNDVNGSLLVVSQFTLCADCSHGNRPGFTGAKEPEEANRMYEKFIELCKEQTSIVEHGEFGADMKVDLVNDGPVTIIIDSKLKF